MSTKYTSPLTSKTYEIYDPSPMIIGLLHNDETETSARLRLEIVNLAKEIEFDTEALKRTDITPQQRAEIQDRLGNETTRLQDMQYKLLAETKIKPAALCEILRTFVAECDGKTDKEIIRAFGKDLDLLFARIQVLADNDSDKYNEAMHKARKFFREPQGERGNAGGQS